MSVSRRQFLGVAVAASALARAGLTAPRCVVLDLGCILPESLAGYEAYCNPRLPAGCGSVADFVIVPGVTSPPPAVQPFLDRGATVLLENAGGFRQPGRRIQQASYYPYVEYSWPVRAMIREFGAVSLRPAPGDEIIGALAKQPVALRRRVARGTLVILGSSLGPVLLTGDPDARRWLDAVLYTSFKGVSL
jgi:hypothetical protein